MKSSNIKDFIMICIIVVSAMILGAAIFDAVTSPDPIDTQSEIQETLNEIKQLAEEILEASK